MKKGEKITMVDTYMFGIYDDDNELRYVKSSLSLAVNKKIDLGWGHIFKTDIKKIGKEFL